MRAATASGDIAFGKLRALAAGAELARARLAG